MQQTAFEAVACVRARRQVSERRGKDAVIEQAGDDAQIGAMGLTPGTPALAQLHDALAVYICRRTGSWILSWGPLRAVWS